MASPTADVSVRVAWSDDAAAVADRQCRGWLAAYAAELDPAQVAATWSGAMRSPGDARNRVLVALERNRVVGYAVVSPAADPDCDPVADAELQELVIDAEERGKGHGSRLLQAVVDTMQADRFTRAVTWAGGDADDLRRFLTEAGWAPDSAHRELDLDGSGETTLKQVRLHTAI
jgi:GNAT superfamily N-acetyltransferase